jgi:hypothetical protein
MRRSSVRRPGVAQGLEPFERRVSQGRGISHEPAFHLETGNRHTTVEGGDQILQFPDQPLVGQLQVGCSLYGHCRQYPRRGGLAAVPKCTPGGERPFTESRTSTRRSPASRRLEASSALSDSAQLLAERDVGHYVPMGTLTSVRIHRKTMSAPVAVFSNEIVSWSTSLSAGN